MARKKIALFTPFSPLSGGGGTIFRSLLTHLSGGEFHWFYLSNAQADYPHSTWLGPNVLGGPLLRDAIQSSMLYCLRWHPSILRYAKLILNWGPDVCWVNAMNEGLLMGETLPRLGMPRVHVSVHDDPSGLAAKSRRYRHLSPFIDRCNRLLLQRATSTDVVSEAMRTYYKERWGVESGVVFRYLDAAAIEGIATQTKLLNGPTPIFIGHIGSAYSLPELSAFLQALRLVESSDGVRFKVIALGRATAFARFTEGFPGLVECAGEVPEPEAVERLRQCKFLYSMYSFNHRHRIFRATSQPTKMSTYLLAGRSIFAHCPQDSSTIQLMSKFQLGVCISTLDKELLASGIRSILRFNLDLSEVRKAAEFYCGERNLINIADGLGLNQVSESVN